MKKTLLLLTTLFILISVPMQAQLELGLQGGKNFMEGDAHCLEDSKINLFTPTGANFGVFARYLFSNRHWGARFNYAYMPLKFDETQFGGSSYHTARGFNGTNKASDVSLDLAYHLLMKKKKWHPYVFGGLGFQLSKYDINFNEAKATTAMKAGIATDKSAKTTNFILPVGAGIEWRVSDRVNLHWENSMRLPLSDYYDGVSAAAFSTNNDWYGYSNLGLSFSLQGDPDSDKDGISDKKDACPKVKGLKIFGGCPDTDEDGIKDSEDRCPTIAGIPSLRGCPDKDGDTVADIDDNCPDIKGLVNLKGCPDSDEDGVTDADDDCPTIKGLAFLRGCPDSDEDGITDSEDACPNVKGSKNMKGCPDSDNDGIADKDDKCPNEKGIAGNNGCPEVKKEEPKVEVVTTTPTTTVTTTTVTQSSSCAACASGNDPIFTSVCNNPKKLSHLGSNPEFGNSHGLTPDGFYNKLKKAYKANKVDREFLDRIYKAMGYSGFVDARPEQFSAVVIPQGTSGKLGYSVLHKTGCYTLPDNEHDRMAFHITAANGCDLHFMKTCGNHFFYCK